MFLNIEFKPTDRELVSTSIPRTAAARLTRLRRIFGPGVRILDAYLRELEAHVLAKLSPAERKQYLQLEALPKRTVEKILGETVSRKAQSAEQAETAA